MLVATLIACSAINHSTGQGLSTNIQCEVNTKCMSIQILYTEYFELFKLKYKTVAVTSAPLQDSASKFAATCTRENVTDRQGAG